MLPRFALLRNALLLWRRAQPRKLGRMKFRMVVAAGGNGLLQSPAGSKVVAFALK